MASLSSEQKQVLSAFIAEGKRQGATYKQMKALVEAGLVESSLRNLNYGDRDSIGSLQERSHYGSKQRRLNPTLAARRFLTEAKSAKGGTSGALAQAVQRSAFPGRYDERGKEAAALLAGFQGGSSAAPSPVGGAQSGSNRALLAQYLLTGRQDTSLLAQAVQSQDTPESVSRPSYGVSGGQGSGNLVEAFYDPLGGIKRGKEIGARGGHSDHVHVAAKTPAQRVKLQKLAERMGLTVTSTTGGKHTAGSYHYSGLAADVSGNPATMAKYYQTVKRIYGI